MVDKPFTAYDIFNSPLGLLFLTFSGKFLSGVSFKKPTGIPLKKAAASEKLINELDLYFRGLNDSFSQEIKFLIGTDFEKKVWTALKKIPYGETRTYKWVAEKIGKPAAVRAVGQALSKNPVPVIIPCHRVIESNGSIGGYSSGVNVKKRLLEMEYYAKMNKMPKT